MNFKQCFFRIYDKKIASGEVTFSQTGIPKNAFTALCTEPDYVFDRELIDKIAVTMHLTEEQKENLIRTANGEEI